MFFPYWIKGFKTPNLMKKIKVMAVFGTRPEAIKMAPLVKELEKSQYIEPITCVTAQHRQMLDQVLDVFKITPEYDLNIMKDNQTLVGIVARSLDGLSRVYDEAKPDLVLVHGDTSTTFVGALAAFYQKIKVGHVEAGLRTFDKYSPYPEEMNRRLTGTLADLHFSPTENNAKNLIDEDVERKDIFVTGNTVIDALKTTVSPRYVFKNEELKKVDFSKRVVCVTAHRRENWGKPLKNICEALKDVANDYKDDIEIVYPVHLNPIVQDTAREILGGYSNVHLIDPLNVCDMHNLVNRSYLVLTDSGGLQEEAPSLGKPVLVLRNETERPEAVEAGTVKILGCDKDSVYKMTKLLDDDDKYKEMARAVNPYGDGFASKRIVESILYSFGVREERPNEFRV